MSSSCSHTSSFCLLVITITLVNAAVTIPTAPVIRQSRPVLQPANLQAQQSQLQPQQQLQQPQQQQIQSQPPKQQPQQLVSRANKPQTVPGNVVRLPNVQPRPPQLVPVQQLPQLKPQQPQQQVKPQAPETASDDSDQSSPEEILDVYFDFIKNNDENNCLMRLICQIGYNRTAFGTFGEQVAGFFTEIESSSGAAAQYRTAFQTHMTEPDVAKCIDKYPSCQYETTDMIEVGNDLMTKNLTNLQLDDVKKGPPAWIGQPNNQRQ